MRVDLWEAEGALGTRTAPTAAPAAPAATPAAAASQLPREAAPAPVAIDNMITKAIRCLGTQVVHLRCWLHFDGKIIL